MNKTMEAKAHADGGTYKVLALANTRDGWAIAITEWTTYRGNVVFEVLRVSPENKTIRLEKHTNEAAARAAGNRAWQRDR